MLSLNLMKISKRFLKRHILITQILMCIYETSSRLLTPVSKIFKHCRLVKNIKSDFVILEEKMGTIIIRCTNKLIPENYD